MKGFGGSSAGYGPSKGFGGSSVGHGPSPPPPSSSTLSPLAPPFNVDHVISKTYQPPSPPAPHDLRDYSPIPAPDNWLRLNPPPHTFPQVDPAADPVRFSGPHPSPLTRSLSSSIVQAEPYYPHYTSVLGGLSSAPARGDDHLGPFSDFGGYPEGHGGVFDRPFDVESGRATMGDDVSSSWMEPNSPGLSSNYNPLCQDVHGPACFGAFEDFSSVWLGKHVDSVARKVQCAPECSVWVDDKPPAFRGDNTRELFNLTETSSLGPNTVAERKHYLHLAGPVSSMRAQSTFNPSSSSYSYNRYNGQLDSCKMEPMIHHPDTTYSSASHVFASSGGRTSTLADTMATNVNSFSQHVDAHNNNVKYRGNVSVWLNPNSNLIADGKEGYNDKRTMSNSLEIGESITANYYLGKRNLLSSVESATRVSVKHPSEIKSELKNYNLKFSNPCNFAPVSVEDNSRSSCETSDQLSIAVDSPCWKGASASRHSPFCVGETAVVYSVCADPKYKDTENTGSDSSTVGNGKGSQCADGLEEQNMTLTHLNDLKSSSEFKDCDAVPLIQEVSDAFATQPVSWNATVHPVTGPNENGLSDLQSFDKDQMLNLSSDGIVSSENVQPLAASDPSNTCSSRRIDNNLLVKMIHNMSEVLLSSYCGDVNSLKEHDHQFLKLAVFNLEKIGSQRTNFGTFPHSDSSFHSNKSSTSCEGNQKDKSEVKGLGAADVLNQNKNNDILDWQAKLHSVRSSMDNGMTKVLEKVLMENFEERGNSLAILYKKLWVEAEVAICALKYELELAKMKIVMENHKQQQAKDTCVSSNTEGKPAEMTIPNLKSMEDPDRAKVSSPIAKQCLSENVSAPEKAVSQDSCMKPKETIHTTLNNKEGIDASVMARLRVLKDRVDRQNSVCMEEKQKLPESLDVGVSVGKKESVCSPFCSVSEIDFDPKLQPISDDSTSAVWRNTWVPNGGGLGDQGLGTKSEIQHLFPNYYERIGPESNISGEQRGSREFRMYTADGLVNRVYMSSNRPGKRFLGGGAESPSSDWEHVLKEELTW